MLVWEKIAPSYVGKGGFAPIMRLTGAIGAGAGFLMFYSRSISESLRAIELKMRVTQSRQTGFTGLKRIKERLTWTCGKWLRRSSGRSRYMVYQLLHPTCKEWLRGTRDTLEFSYMLCLGSILLAMNK